MATEPGHLPRGPIATYRALIWSLNGLKAAWLHEASFRLEVVIALALAPLSFLASQDPLQRALLIVSLLWVLSLELLNSAIEAVIERYGPEFHELAGRAKDMGSAAVFVGMLGTVCVWVGVLLQ
jgi:diacylglycerol kinase (ATP)